jgi:hypothetical protein
VATTGQAKTNRIDRIDLRQSRRGQNGEGSDWVRHGLQVYKRGVKQEVYANNRYDGFRAVTIEKFKDFCKTSADRRSASD